MTQSFRRAGRVDRGRAFTLIEVLVSMTVLVLLIGVIAQMTGGVASIVGRGGARIDTDGQARALLDRMAIDIGAMVKRPDVDYYLKGRPSTSLTQPGNDQIAFYSAVPGYFASGTTPTTESSVSMVAYRVNSTTMHMERLCKGMSWNGASTGNTMGFLPVPLASPLPTPTPSSLPTPTPAPIVAAAFPEAAEPTDPDPTHPDLDWEELGPQVFRFEYYYVLKGQIGLVTSTSGSPQIYSSMLSIVPWYAAIPGHTSVNGMQDVAAVGVLIAVIDPKSRVLLTNTQLTSLANNMEDAPAALTDPGVIEQSWLNTVNSSTLPKRATAAIRVYTRCFYLNGVSP